MKRVKTQQLIQSALLLALLIIFTFIKFPLGAISFTMQLFIVFLIAQISTVWNAMLIIFLYLFLGLIGLPIFSMGGGLSYVYQPSFGFMIGFMLLCPFVKLFDCLLQKLKVNPYVSAIIANFIGLIIDYICGFIYAYLIFIVHMKLDYSFGKVFQLVIAPFILLDIAKCILAGLIGQRLKKILPLTKNPQ